MDSIQVTLKSTQPIVDFVDKHSNGLSRRLLSWSATGYYIEPHFGKVYLQEGDWLVYDGYSFIPYTGAHYKKIYSQPKQTISELEKQSIRQGLIIENYQNYTVEYLAQIENLKRERAEIITSLTLSAQKRIYELEELVDLLRTVVGEMLKTNEKYGALSTGIIEEAKDVLKIK